MASTTKTTNLELSQFVGTDKPAWLTDYNGDMQKIDNGYKKLEDANTATQADLDATKQDLSGKQTEIDDVKASVQALEAQDIAIGNRLIVLEGNYDTMHHEVAVNADNIAANEAAINTNSDDITTINKKLNGQEATGIIKYNMGTTDKIKSIEIRTTGSNKQDLSLYVTTASGDEKFIHLYSYDKNVILPDFYSELGFGDFQTESITLAAGEEKNFILPISADIICATNVRSNNPDIRCYSYFLENSQTENAKANFWIKNYGTNSWTGTIFYAGVRAIRKGVSVQ